LLLLLLLMEMMMMMLMMMWLGSKSNVRHCDMFPVQPSQSHCLGPFNIRPVD